MMMETLNNFASIYCFITFIMGAVFMLIAVCVVAMGKVKEPRNKVRFYVTKFGNSLALWFGKPQYKSYGFESNEITVKILAYKSRFKDFGLNPDYFNDIKEDEIREVFINLED